MPITRLQSTAADWDLGEGGFIFWNNRRGFYASSPRSESARGSSSPAKTLALPPPRVSHQAAPRWSSSGKPASPFPPLFPRFGSLCWFVWCNFRPNWCGFDRGVALLQVLDEAEQRNGDHRAQERHRRTRNHYRYDVLRTWPLWELEGRGTFRCAGLESSLILCLWL